MLIFVFLCSIRQSVFRKCMGVITLRCHLMRNSGKCSAGDVVPGDLLQGDFVPGDLVSGDLLPDYLVPGD